MGIVFHFREIILKVERKESKRERGMTMAMSHATPLRAGSAVFHRSENVLIPSRASSRPSSSIQARAANKKSLPRTVRKERGRLIADDEAGFDSTFEGFVGGEKGLLEYVKTGRLLEDVGRNKNKEKPAWFMWLFWVVYFGIFSYLTFSAKWDDGSEERVTVTDQDGKVLLDVLEKDFVRPSKKKDEPLIAPNYEFPELDAMPKEYYELKEQYQTANQ